MRHLLPIALERLAEQPWIEACGQPGDLLLVVLGVEGVSADSGWRDLLAHVVTVAEERLDQLGHRDRARVEGWIVEASARLAASTR